MITNTMLAQRAAKAKAKPTAAQMQPVKSSFIAAIGYNPQTRIAAVKFNSGKVYTYANVHPNTYTGWLKAPSNGKYFHRNIKGQYAYQLVA